MNDAEKSRTNRALAMNDAEKSRFNTLAVIEQVRDLCRARQIACVALSHSDIEIANPEDVKTAFFAYRDAAVSLSKVLEII